MALRIVRVQLVEAAVDIQGSPVVELQFLVARRLGHLGRRQHVGLAGAAGFVVDRQGRVHATLAAVPVPQAPPGFLRLQRPTSHQLAARQFRQRFRIVRPSGQHFGPGAGRRVVVPVAEVAPSAGGRGLGPARPQLAGGQTDQQPEREPAQMRPEADRGAGLRGQQHLRHLQQDPQRHRPGHGHRRAAHLVLPPDGSEHPPGDHHPRAVQPEHGQGHQAGNGPRGAHDTQSTLSEKAEARHHPVHEVTADTEHQHQRQQRRTAQTVLQRRRQHMQVEEIARQVQPRPVQEDGGDHRPGPAVAGEENVVPGVGAQPRGQPPLPDVDNRERRHQRPGQQRASPRGAVQAERKEVEEVHPHIPGRRRP